MGSAREVFNPFENAFLDVLEWALHLASEEFLEARSAKHLFVGIHGLGNAIAEEHQSVARLELQAYGCVFGFRNQANGIRTFGKCFFGDAAANEERRRMAGVDEFQMALLIEDAEEHGCIAANL